MANEVRGEGFCAFGKVLFWIATSSTSNEVKQRETQIDYQKQAGSFWITKGRRKWAESCALSNSKQDRTMKFKEKSVVAKSSKYLSDRYAFLEQAALLL